MVFIAGITIPHQQLTTLMNLLPVVKIAYTIALVVKRLLLVLLFVRTTLLLLLVLPVREDISQHRLLMQMILVPYVLLLIV